jgi:hypothetical protein
MEVLGDVDGGGRLTHWHAWDRADSLENCRKVPLDAQAERRDKLRSSMEM